MSERQYSEDEVKDLTDGIFLLRQKLEEGKIFFAGDLIDGFRTSFEAQPQTPSATRQALS